MTVVYNTFADWENSFFVKDLSADLPLTNEQKQYTMLGIVLENDDDIYPTIYNIIRLGIKAHVYGIIVDYHILPSKEKLKGIIELLTDSGYIDTESYAYRLGYFRNWNFGDFGWALESGLYEIDEYRRFCYPLDYCSLTKTFSQLPVEIPDNIDFEAIGKKLATLVKSKGVYI